MSDTAVKEKRGRRRGEKPTPEASSPAVLPPTKSRRRPMLIAAGIALAVVGGLGSWYFFTTVGNTTTVLTVNKEELPAPVDEFRRGLRRAARAAGIRVLTSRQGGSFIAWDPAFEVPAEALRAAMDALTILPSTVATCPDDLVVMRDAPGGGWVCPECGRRVELPPSTRPKPDDTGIPGINGG